MCAFHFGHFWKCQKCEKKIVATRDSCLFSFVGEKSDSKSYGPFILHDLNSKWVQTHVCMAWRKKDFCYTILSSWTYGFEMTFEFFVQKDWAATAPFFTSKCVRIIKLKSVGTAVNFDLPLTYEHKCRWFSAFSAKWFCLHSTCQTRLYSLSKLLWRSTKNE